MCAQWQHLKRSWTLVWGYFSPPRKTMHFLRRTELFQTQGGAAVSCTAQVTWFDPHNKQRDMFTSRRQWSTAGGDYWFTKNTFRVKGHFQKKHKSTIMTQFRCICITVHATGIQKIHGITETDPCVSQLGWFTNTFVWVMGKLVISPNCRVFERGCGCFIYKRHVGLLSVPFP